jgi:hypothetical protein
MEQRKKSDCGNWLIVLLSIANHQCDEEGTAAGGGGMTHSHTKRERNLRRTLWQLAAGNIEPCVPIVVVVEVEGRTSLRPAQHSLEQQAKQ